MRISIGIKSMTVAVALSLFSAMAVVAQDAVGDIVTDSAAVATDSIIVAKDSITGRPGARKWNGPAKEKIPFFAGFSVSADVVGLVMKVGGSTFSQLEIAGRINIKERVFPIVELGVGMGDREGNSKNNVFHTSAPYFRVGFDVNANKKRTSNRLMFGLRVGYSSYNYDYTGPAMTDPVWGETIPVDMQNVDASAVWGEFAFGFETKVWSFIRLGWNARYKFRFHQNTYEYGEPWYIPGYGPNGSNCWGGTVNIIFDFGKTMKKGK